ncbi:Cobyrinic acid ac-diamide synthase (plasmid) [Crinalium epipsammum PCC 9333]|uniref:Cobyrinic acid ac-diamide synthase n=1 Tax=Crinalium epipsammum PCC 9333 TaxID=1173022 RepID=K9W8B2_9CYAN|nr:ParA family protein [Crinalium epipsammum]AFZ15715.1 Cobyrinic acid ac-diamide synthase [Crinalium epipsammum PCC 9333]
MQTCACVSLSGGQGKTTVIFNLSLLLAQQGKKVLAVDCDPQANLTFYLNHEVEPNQPTLLEVLNGKVQTEDGIYSTTHENLFLMPSDRSLFKVSEYLASSGTGAFILKLRLKAVQNLFDLVLIDVQPSRSQICLTAVGAADYALIPVEAATKGVNSLIDTLEFLEEQASVMAFNGKVLGIIPFRDRWVGLTQTLESRENIATIKEFAGDIPVLPSIRESEQFKRAIRQGKLLSDIGQKDLQYPFEKMIEVLTNER